MISAGHALLEAHCRHREALAAYFGEPSPAMAGCSPLVMLHLAVAAAEAKGICPWDALSFLQLVLQLLLPFQHLR